MFAPLDKAVSGVASASMTVCSVVGLSVSMVCSSWVDSSVASSWLSAWVALFSCWVDGAKLPERS